MMLRGIYTCLTVLVLSLMASTNVLAAKVYRWTLAETWPANFPIWGEQTRSFAKAVEEMSNGRLLIRVDSSSKHKSAFGIFDMVRSGRYQMGHSASYYWKGKDANTLYFAGMPFGMNSSEQYAWFYYGGGMELMKEVYGKYGILSFPGGNTGNQMGGWFREEIKSVRDLKGLKMRIPGFAGEVLASVGAKPTNIAPGELYTALERGTIDALEWVGPSLDLRMGFHKVAPYYYTGWHEPGTELQFMINARAWKKLPDDLKAIVLSAMKAAAFDLTVQGYAASVFNWEQMKKEYPNIQVRSFPKSVIRALQKANDKLIAKAEAEGSPLTKRIIRSQRDFMNSAREWTMISEYAYLKSASDNK